MLLWGENQQQHAGSGRWAQSLVAHRRCGDTPKDVDGIDVLASESCVGNLIHRVETQVAQRVVK